MSDGVSSNVEFSWKQFWVSFLYENLPPVFVSPLAALIVERSRHRAWNVCQNRNLLIVSSHGTPLFFVLFAWLVTYPGSWLITAGLIITLTQDVSASGAIDPLQMIFAFSLIFMRRLIIAVKYGYFSEEEYTALSGPPGWNYESSQRKLIAQGWSRPTEYEGLISYELEETMQAQGINLKDMHMESGDGKRHNLFTIARGVIHNAYGNAPPRWFNPLILLSAVIILGSLLYVRDLFGTPLLGDGWQEITVTLAIYAGMTASMGLMGFGLLCAHDFDRRVRASELYYRALVPPGLNLDMPEGETENVFFDKHSPNCVNGWVQSRNVVRGFGERFYRRVQSYTSLLITYSVICVGVLNFMMWTQIPHQAATAVTIGATIFVISFIGSYAMYSAIRLQRTSYLQRASLQRELLSLEVEIGILAQEGVQDDEMQRLVTAKTLLQQVDENVNYEELVFRPTSILGYRAEGGLIGSILGIVITGALLILQGFASMGINYSSIGWFGF
ncbi:MAG: hypothetical protein L7U47_01035 [Alphaproteobacteria bacterium]|nr:hypothetical protein [Alphaproteobacteria bacterium]